MTTEQKKPEERKKRSTATEAASKVATIGKAMLQEGQRAKSEGKKTAFTFIFSGYDEIIRTMGIVPIWTENFAGICGAKRDAQRFLERAEGQNLSRSLCTYALCGIGFDSWREELAGQMPPNAPWGGQPKPDMMLSSGQVICDPRNKWYQAAQHYMPDVPIYNVDLPQIPFEADYNYKDVMNYYVKHITEQLQGLVAFLEKQTGTKMDYAKLADTVALTDRTWSMIIDAYELRMAVPCPMGTGDAMNTMVPMSFLMGTQQAYNYYKDLYDELLQKNAKKEGAVPNEKYRLLWGGGLPSWFALSDFNYFESKGAVFPAEITYRQVEHIDRLDIPVVTNPLEHIAWRWVKWSSYWHNKARRRPGSSPEVERLINYIEEYKIDGIVMHEAFSCRSWHVGLIWELNQLKKIYRDIPTLILESDIIDISSYNEADTRARIDTFVDTLTASKR
jgi:benzoyl-CoA reductase/2-hydroxyglutaryl-CoA dehydratase subunit BcrC/BadD/HgdB